MELLIELLSISNNKIGLYTQLMDDLCSYYRLKGVGISTCLAQLISSNIRAAQMECVGYRDQMIVLLKKEKNDD